LNIHQDEIRPRFCTKADAEEHTLEAASAEGWESAKISFEKASLDLKKLWDKIGSNAK